MKQIMFFLLFMVSLVAMMAGQALYKQDPTINIQDVANNLTVNTTNITSQIVYNNTDKAFINIVAKTTDWALFSTFEIGKWSLAYGFKNPNTNYHHIFWTSIILMIIGTIYPALPLLLAILYGCYLLGHWLIKKYKYYTQIT